MAAQMDQNELADGRVRSGRRKAVDIDSPRDRTVCFMVSAEEKAEIDVIAASVGRTRSAVLTRIVTGFLLGVTDGDGPESGAHELAAFMRECRESVFEE
jgi:hypothetical protein